MKDYSTLSKKHKTTASVLTLVKLMISVIFSYVIQIQLGANLRNIPIAWFSKTLCTSCGSIREVDYFF